MYLFLLISVIFYTIFSVVLLQQPNKFYIKNMIKMEGENLCLLY